MTDTILPFLASSPPLPSQMCSSYTAGTSPRRPIVEQVVSRREREFKPFPPPNPIERCPCPQTQHTAPVEGIGLSSQSGLGLWRIWKRAFPFSPVLYSSPGADLPLKLLFAAIAASLPWEMAALAVIFIGCSVGKGQTSLLLPCS